MSDSKCLQPALAFFRRASTRFSPALSEKSRFCRMFLLAASLLLFAERTHAGSILREVFQGIGGNAVSDLTSAPIYPNSPTLTNIITDFFEAPINFDENYGQRIHGYIVPPVSGNYVFWIASDDEGLLYLSTDEDPVNKVAIASVPGWTASREWTKFAEQQSAPVSLQAGKAYYISALEKEGGGGDHLAVRWLRPDAVDEGPIPATYLLAWGTSFTPPIISQQPTNTTVVEGDLATFLIKLKNLDGATFQWRRNGVDIPGGANGTLIYGPVTLSDSNAVFGASLTNRLGGTNSATATLTVVPDITKPTLVSARNLGNTNISMVFSEAVSTATALNPLSYTVSGGIGVSGVSPGADNRTVLLAVSPLSFGLNYTVTVNGVQDRAATPNTILPNSQITFLALEFVSQGIGIPNGSIQRIGPGAFDVTGGGFDLGGADDQSQFAWEQRTGNFDVQVRLAGATLSSPFFHGGLMARGTLETNSAFAGVFGSSAQMGCVFESRLSTSAASSTATLDGGFPVNYPLTWLRLRRVGNVFTGFASLDGQTWVQLGTATLTVPSTVYVGLSVASQNANSSTAQFRDYGNTTSLAVGTYKPDREPLGPSSRRTRLVISEIMYHPKPPAGVTNDLEFIELYNAGEIFEDLTGWTITGGVSFSFPAGFKLAAGDFVVVASNPAALQSVYGITGVLGPFTGLLNNGSDTVRLRDASHAIKLEVNYSSNPPWPVAADGAGHSLVLRNPSFGEDNPLAWGTSEIIGGSPGQVDTIRSNPQRAVVINEFLAHTDEPQLDFIELYNHSLSAVDLSGCYLTDDAATNKFRIPDGTIIPARGFLSWDQNQLGFRLSAEGESVFLVNSNATRVIDAVKFAAQENGVSSGRSPDGSATIRRLAQPTAGAANAPWRQEDIVINEIMFNPISGESADEYVELYNRGTNSMNVAGWKFISGIDYKIPSGTTLAPGGFLVVAKDSARLLANYAQLNTNNTRGNYDGSLKNSGERLALAMPDDVVSTNLDGELSTNKIQIVIAEVTYGSGGRWNYYADGGGSSLELIDPNADPLRAANWADSDETQKAAWTSFEFTGPLNLGHDSYPPNRFRIGMLGAGECLVDELEIFKTGGVNLLTNPGFESGVSGWSIFGNHSTSFVEAGGAFAGSNSLHVRGQGDSDTGINAIRADIAGLASGDTATIRAKVRWLAGWPEILFRVSGNWIEMPVRMNVPKNLGTPGLANTRKVSNAGPAIYDVTHQPILPRANEAVVVTCRISDPDGFGSLTLRYRVDPTSTVNSVAMRDDGTGGDAVAGDGVYSATISGRSGGTLIGFKIQATDSTSAQTTTFPKQGLILPAAAPSSECLVRWDDPIPAGTFAHYHLWNTVAVDNLRANSLNNTYREATLVYGNFRVLYNVGFRDKGSPYHGGGGSFALVNGSDDLLLGASERVFRSTGNGGEEGTGIRNPVCAWIGQQLGIPYLNTHYMRLYRFNGQGGGPIYNVMFDEEIPTGDYASKVFPSDSEGDLYKIAIWFEFNDDNSGFAGVSSTLESFKSGNAYKLARYRWNWQTRGYGGTVNNYSNLFNLVTAANDNSANFVPNLLNLADIEEWMRVFAFHRIIGNWDSWSFGVGQNMYAYKLPETTWKIMPWDIDFTLGSEAGSNGPTDALWGGQDPILNKFFDNFALRRMLWRGFEDAVNGLMLPENYSSQVDARRLALQVNGLGGLASPGSIATYINARRSYLLGQINGADAPQFNITTGGGNDFTSATPSATITGNAPFAVATIEVNGVPYLVKWTGYTTFSINVPLTQVTNTLVLVGKDLRGNPIPGTTDSITVTYNGAVPQARDFVSLNEIQYDPNLPNGSFIELFNRSTTTPFDLSNFRLEGVGYTFAEGAVIQPNSFLVLAKDRAAFSLAYGSTIPVFDVFPGSLDNGGETLRLVQPGGTPGTDVIITDVRYDQKLPWATNAAGFGPSLQLIDAAQDEYRVGNWTATATNDANRVTPGRANGVRQTLTPFPLVWLNEIVPNNLSGLTDNAGDRDPWIELYNSGDTTIDLSPYYLANNYTNLTQWQFPAGTTIGPKQFLLVWADGEPGESVSGAPHTSFRMDPVTGSIALARLQGSPTTPAVMDYIDYSQLPADRGFGSYPDGEPRKRLLFHFVTPNGTNNPAAPEIKVTINEFMAGNTLTIADPADGHFDDWFELYNAGTNAVDLTGYTLTDNLTNANQFTIPPGYVIPPGEFLLVWADNDTKQNLPANADLHTNFKLALAGEQLGLFAPDGTLVDGIAFGAQSNDISMGRFPDGSEPPLVFMESTTPRLPNVLAGGNKPPTLNPIGNKSVAEQTLLNFTATATEPDGGQTLAFSLSADAPAGATIDASSGQFTWVPTEEQGPGSYSFMVRVTDSGIPARSATERIIVTVTEVNRGPALDPISDQVINEGALLSVTASATDSDAPVNMLAYSLDAGAPTGASIDSATGIFTWTPSENQGPGNYSITVRVTDNGVPTLADAATFHVTVNEVNNPPVMDIQPQTAEELSLFTLTVTAVDPDSPPSPILYSFDLAPPGAQINPTNGVITWTPTEEQGPMNATLVVRATETVPPGLSAVKTFTVSVTEKNQAPTLQPLADGTVEEGATVSFTASASDADLPKQTLNYSLLPGAPADASIDANTGAFTWATPEDGGATTNVISVHVSDNGPGNLSDTRTFTLITTPKLRVVLNEIMFKPAVTGAEFVELANASGTTTWDISGWTLLGRNLNFTFGANTHLAPGAFLCVAADVAKFKAAYGAALPLAGAWTGSITNDDDLRLVRPGTPDSIVARVTFRGSAPWPANANGGGASLQLVDARRDNSRVANWSAAASYSGPRNLIVITNQWRYYQSGPVDATWSTNGFNDSSWSQGAALLYVENAALPAPKNTPLTLGQNTYYFRTRFTIPNVPSGASLILTNVLDDGAVFYLNGREIYRQGIAPGPVDFNTPGFDYLNPPNAVGDATFAGPFTLPADGLLAGENVFAVELHQVLVGSSDIVFGCSLDLEGGNIPGLTPGASNNVTAALPEFPPVWINEVLPNNTSGITDSNGEREPWIELVNTGDQPVALDGWSLTDNYANLTKWNFPAGTVIQPGQYLLIFADGEPGDATATELHTNFRLNATTGSIALSRPQLGTSAVVDYLDYAGLAANSSIASLPNGQLHDREITTTPTPGASNESGAVSNQAPVLGALVSRAVTEGALLQFTATATDPDLPAQGLTFALGTGAPDGATIDPTTGLFSWTPLASQAPGTNEIVVRVTDNGSPIMSDEKSFVVVVHVLTPSLAQATLTPEGLASFSWGSVAGKTYRVEFKDHLNDPLWQTLVEIPAISNTTTYTAQSPLTTGQRFYRVVRLP
jgi:regulation of enolase protein 1 (concanavalin A-like superfamily)